MSVEKIQTSAEPKATFTFRHTSTYHYTGPVEFGRHRVVMRPRESHYQRLESMTLETNPKSEIHWSEDIFGNMIALVDFSEASKVLSFSSTITVRRTPPPEGFEEGIQVKRPVHYRGIEESATFPYRQSTYPLEVASVRNWLKSQNVRSSDNDSSPLFDDLAALIKQEIGYQRREEPGVQPPQKTLRLGTGSCRDTAVLMMESARAMGFAARFVSGYMESANSKVARGSTHAWTEIYLPAKGWVGYDPSIGKRIGLGHISVGVSNHPRGVMPISGTFSGNGQSFSRLEVSISSERQ